MCHVASVHVLSFGAAVLGVMSGCSQQDAQYQMIPRQERQLAGILHGCSLGLVWRLAAPQKAYLFGLQRGWKTMVSKVPFPGGTECCRTTSQQQEAEREVGVGCVVE
jgi:hypothetical protein